MSASSDISHDGPATVNSLERTLIALGLALLVVFAVGTAWGERGRLQGLAEFAAMHPAAAVRTTPVPIAIATPSPTAVATLPATPTPAAPAALAPARSAGDAPIAVLRIAAIALEVPVRRGTAALVLERGAGLVEGSPPPGSDGNVAIAAHRDGWFRGLRELAVGDWIELEAAGGTRRYRVTDLSVVRPEDIGVLADVGAPVLTLVTCYPFTFVGRAPQRFVVRGVAETLRT